MLVRCLVLVAPLLLAASTHAAPARLGLDTGILVGTVTEAETGEPLIGAAVRVDGTTLGAATGAEGRYRIVGVPAGSRVVRASYIGYESVAQTGVPVQSGQTLTVDFALSAGSQSLEEVVVSYDRPTIERSSSAARAVSGADIASPGIARRSVRQEDALPQFGIGRHGAVASMGRPMPRPDDREGYAAVEEVGFRTARDAPLSTFSIDVDRASYANARRYLSDGMMPPEDAVRVEEFVNAFDYGLDGPADAEHPFAVSTEITTAPWAPAHHLVRIGLQGRRIDTENLPPANLVFLLDVSGSMSSPDKLPLVKRALRLLVREMRDEDHVSIVVYAGAAGLVLPPTSGRDRGRILNALDQLQSGGSTAGGAGLRLAYATAREQFDAGATNRVILATDGDFNVGESSDAAMQRLIEEERESGVFLSVLGFGTGNLQDSKMEAIADHGNGNYSYIDSIREAERVLVREFGGTLFAIAKDVKLQVEFNPARVAGYRLIGYENRALANEDFADDQKDAGELGAGHTVTALYEIVPVGVEVPTAGVDGLRYQTAPRLTEAASTREWLTVSLRYKPATDGGTCADRSVRLGVPVEGAVAPLAEASEATRWAVAVTEAALLLGASDYAPGASYDHALSLARGARGQDPHGDRAEFVRLVETARALVETERQRQTRPVAMGE